MQSSVINIQSTSTQSYNLLNLYMVEKRTSPIGKIHRIPMEISMYLIFFQQLREKTALFNGCLKSGSSKENQCLSLWGKTSCNLAFWVSEARTLAPRPAAIRSSMAKNNKDPEDPGVNFHKIVTRCFSPCALDTLCRQRPWFAQCQGKHGNITDPNIHVQLVFEVL